MKACDHLLWYNNAANKLEEYTLTTSVYLQISSEEWWIKERAWKCASSIREKGEKTDKGKDYTPCIPVIGQGGDLILCRYFFPASKEGCKQAPSQAEDTATQPTKSQ